MLKYKRSPIAGSVVTRNTAIARRRKLVNIRASILIALLLACLPVAVHASVVRQDDAVIVRSAAYTLTLSARDGSIVSLVSASGKPLLASSGDASLWSLKMRDGSIVTSAQSLAANPSGYQCTVDAANGIVTFAYAGSQADVTITLAGKPAYIDISAQVTPKTQAVLDVSAPGTLRFDPNSVQQFVCAADSGAVGLAFNKAFFFRQPIERPAGWTTQPAGPGGYQSLFGDVLDQRPVNDPPVALSPTSGASDWMSADLVKRVASMQAVVNRAPKPGQADLVLVTSPNGPYVSASHLKGTGYLWRIGGGISEHDAGAGLLCLTAVLHKLATEPGGTRHKIGLIDLTNGPLQGTWTTVAVEDWEVRLRQIAAGKASHVEFVPLHTPAEWLAAAATSEYAAIVNPYGESLPLDADKTIGNVVPAIGRYVKDGGNWFETAGYSFFTALTPSLYYKHSVRYPPAFADFAQLDADGGSVAVFGVQPRRWANWSGKADQSKLFVDGALSCEGDAQGGAYTHTFTTYIPPATRWRSPIVRLLVGQPVASSIQEYAADNALVRKLDDKIKPDTLAKLKNSVMVFLGGSASEKTSALPLIPSPSLIHFSDYLHGGFDKQYPDHLPPNAGFGSPEQLRAFFDRAHAAGDLVMPYTNPTWWCDHPRGPTFEREGESPLTKTLDGKLAYERYAKNDGWTCTPWHPAVQAANRKTRAQFTMDFPVDVLFQDQVGARGLVYDTNPAAPTPAAFTEGLLSQAGEDSSVVPLGTENGWDQLANMEAYYCGITWDIVPTAGGPVWRKFIRDRYPESTWKIFPLAQAIAHDKVMFIHHDLGQFVTNRETAAWTLALGYGMSDRISAVGLTDGPARQWLLWLDRLQKSVCSRYIGQPMTAFSQDRGPAGDDGVLHAVYGPVDITANVSHAERSDLPEPLAPFSFFARAPGMVAADAGDSGGNYGYVSETRGDLADLWIFGAPEQLVTARVPLRADGSLTVREDGGATMHVAAKEGTISFRLPAIKGSPSVQPPEALAGSAPRDWPGPHPAIGVLDIQGANASYAAATPSQWKIALEHANFVSSANIAVVRITSYSELATACREGGTRWIAIINPYGESFLEDAPGRWKEALDLVRDYVKNGGSWWETGGYSLHRALFVANGQIESEQVGPDGMRYLGLAVGGGELDQAPEALSVTRDGKRILGDDVSKIVSNAYSAVNRDLSGGENSGSRLTLLQGQRGNDFLGGYRLGGWGWFWRFGGTNPSPDAAIPAAVATLRYIYTHPPDRTTASGSRTMRHFTVEK